MASTAAYNDKHVEVLTPKGASLNDSSEVAYAVHVDVITAAKAPPQHPIPTGLVAPTLPNDWEIGFCECFCAPAHCCMAFFFPFFNGAYAAQGIGRSWVLAGIFFLVTYYGASLFQYEARTYEVVEEYDAGSYTTTYFYGDSSISTGALNWYDTISSACSLLFITGVIMLRGAFRTFYQLPGSFIEDCCYSFWCSCCALSQMSAHVARAKDKQAAATLPAYTAA
ncbi:Plac8 family protein [Globisporangium polare]